MPDIVTLTMNPALDVSTSAETVVPTDKVRCGAVQHDPGGGGINVARVVQTLGGHALAVFPAGGPTGLMLERLLGRAGVPSRHVTISGFTRESFTVDERRSGLQYRFVLPGPEISAAERQACLEELARAAEGARIIVLSGSFPPGLSHDFVQDVADLSKRLGCRFVLDTSGEALRHVKYGAYLLKPSIRELREWVGQELHSEAEQVEAARQLIDRGITEVMVVSQGAEGALLVTADGHEKLAPIEVPIKSAVGAGDSMVAAICFGLVQGLDLRHAIRLGMAAGAATLMTPGTGLCRREDVERLYAERIAQETIEPLRGVGSG
ncbi:phosphofructokinase [Microvirga sp. KLBC 81]|uniref:1-phosphofructokinase family hexose kinase n=1 Tax=Microvirga sp. KLBC 81 TaxID=1862707 RepID=UPI000D515F30|nr:1-phosphofructokinase family hexose kinase [Microvirga sp. KLBC 81]PVE23415.1 phosphofructokinase [Microvirga sp. KLBC 81]